jgi:hypothetical protein
MFLLKDWVIYAKQSGPEGHSEHVHVANRVRVGEGGLPTSDGNLSVASAGHGPKGKQWDDYT